MQALYRDRFAVLGRVAEAIENQLRGYLDGVPRIDRVCARAKSIERFEANASKIENGISKYRDPIHEIQDQLGARIIVFYLSDIEPVVSLIGKYYRPVESKLLIPDSDWEFGYFGRHLILLTPTEVSGAEEGDLVPDFFELQIKTLFQHAWSEANHDLGYKPLSQPLGADKNRKLAFTAAQAWGADTIFQELLDL